LQGVLAALAAGKLKLATLPTLVFTLSNTYGAHGCGSPLLFCSGAGGWRIAAAAALRCGVPPALPALGPLLHSLRPLKPTCTAPPGLIVIIALLGYGLVEIPRIFWRRPFPETRLKYHYHRVGRAAERLTDSRCGR